MKSVLLQRTCALVTFYAIKCRRKVYRKNIFNGGWSVSVFHPISIPASGTLPNTKGAAVNTEKSELNVQ